MELNTIKRMERYARHDATVISLGQGIPALPSHDYIRMKTIEAISGGFVDSYSDPQGMLPLRDALVDHLRQRSMDYSADEIIVTNGAIEALNVALKSVVTFERTNIVIPTPVYSAYFKLIEVAGGVPVEVELVEEKGWKLDVEALLHEINNETAAVLLCNPNNPTGTVYAQGDLEQIVQTAQQCGAVVIIDEVYSNMVYGDQAFYTPASNPSFKETVIRITSFSKDFSLTGWRIGYMHASAARIAKLLGVHDTMVNCAPVVSQYAALAALDIYDDVIQRNKAVYETRRSHMAYGLQKLQGLFNCHIPQGAYFFFPRIMTGDLSNDFAQQLVEDAGVVVVPGASFGKGGEQHVRLCFGRNAAGIDEAMARLRHMQDKVVE